MGSWSPKRVRSRRNTGKLHSNVLHFAIEKGRRKKEEAKKKKGDGSRECKVQDVLFQSPPTALPPPPH